jgi:hypothetical protein
MSGKSVDATTALANDDKQALSRQATGERSTIATEDTAPMTQAKTKTAMKKAKKKVARNDNVSGNPPISATSGAAANSLTGSSPGGDGGSGSSGSAGSSQ